MATAMATAATAATAATMVTATAMEEEECDECDGADPQRRLDDSLLRLADIRLIAATTGDAAVRRRWSLATTTMSMPSINIDALFIGREDREGNDGSSVVTEDDDNADAEAGEYARNFLEVVLRQLWEGRFGRRRTTTKTTETSSDNEHKEDVVTWSISKTLCEGEPSSSSSTARLKHQSLATTAARAGGADPSRTKGSRTG